MEIIIVENQDAVAKAAAELIGREVLVKKQAVLGLATGTTPIATYDRLIEYYRAGILSFSEVLTFNLDEYVGLDSEDPQSYHYYMQDHLFSHIDIKQENVHLLRGDAKNIDLEIVDYERDIRDSGGVDLQLLGIGANGHIGFNEPGTPFGSSTQVVELAEKTIEDNARFFSSMEEVPKKAISMGIRTIMNAKKIVLIAYGENKSWAIKQMVEGNVTEEVPASILQLHPNVTIIIDKGAAEGLSC